MPLRADRSSVFVYSYDVRYAGDSLLTDQRGSDGVVSYYGYTSHGLVLTSTLSYGTALAQTTTYGYDALDRMVIRNTTPYTYNGDGALVFDARRAISKISLRR